MGATSRWVARAKQAAATLKSEYQAGKRGDDTPAEPIWPTPRQQLDGLLALWKSRDRPALGTELDVISVNAPAAEGTEEPGTEEPGTEEPGTEGVAEGVADAMRGIDWAAVRAATSERTGEAARAMRAAAEHVDWAKVQPVAAQVSSALLAAVASGRLGIGGALGANVARTIANQGGLAQRVAHELRDQPGAMPPDFRQIIEVTPRPDTP